MHEVSLQVAASKSGEKSSIGVRFGSESSSASTARRSVDPKSVDTPSTTGNRSYQSLSSLTMSNNSSSQSTEASSATKNGPDVPVIDVVTNMPPTPEARKIRGHASEQAFEDCIESGYDTDGELGPSNAAIISEGEQELDEETAPETPPPAAAPPPGGNDDGAQVTGDNAQPALVH